MMDNRKTVMLLLLVSLALSQDLPAEVRPEFSLGKIKRRMLFLHGAFLTYSFFVLSRKKVSVPSVVVCLFPALLTGRSLNSHDPGLKSR